VAQKGDPNSVYWRYIPRIAGQSWIKNLIIPKSDKSAAKKAICFPEVIILFYYLPAKANIYNS
jgi:hypothetical protein